MIPSALLVLLFVVPLTIGVFAIADATLVWPMLAADGAIVVAAAIDAMLSRSRLVDVRRTCDPVFSVGRPNPVHLEVRSRSARRIEVDVTQDLFDFASADELPLRVSVPARGTVRVTYNVVPTRRGAYELGAHTLRHRSRLGLWIRQIRSPAANEIRVYPDVQAVRAYELLARQNREQEMVRATRQRGGENEFEALREYTPDDDYRSLDWKATARRGKLICRQYQLERNQTILFALDAGRLMTAKVDGLPLFDHALNAALMLTHVAVRGGDHVGMFTFSDDVLGFVAPTGGRGALRRLVRSTFDVHPELRESDMAAVFGRVSPQLRKRSLVVLMTQVIDDVSAQELLRVSKSLYPRHLALCVLFRDPGLEALADPGTAPASAYTAAAAAGLLDWRDRWIRELEHAGALVLDVEPRALTPALIGRYLDVKVRHLL